MVIRGRGRVTREREGEIKERLGGRRKKEEGRVRGKMGRRERSDHDTRNSVICSLLLSKMLWLL